MPDPRNIFDKVLYLGPDIRARGGIATVLGIYSRCITPFHYRATNSRRGTLPGLLSALAAMAAIPLGRLRGRRILHLHYASGRSLLRKAVMMRIGRLCGYRTVMHCHSNVIAAAGTGSGPARLKGILDKADYNIFLCEEYAAYARNSLGIKPVKVVRNIMFPHPEYRRERPADGDTVTFIFLSVINAMKGFADLIEAVRRLRASGRRLRLIVAGAPDDGTDVAALLKEKGVEDTVTYLGWISGDDVAMAMSQADVLVLPSRQEAMPMCILEAIASAKPVISTAIASIPELVDDGLSGYLVTPRDTDALTDRMARYIDDPRLVAVHGDAAAAHLKEFSPESVLDVLAGIYTEILGKH